MAAVKKARANRTGTKAATKSKQGKRCWTGYEPTPGKNQAPKADANRRPSSRQKAEQALSAVQPSTRW